MWVKIGGLEPQKRWQRPEKMLHMSNLAMYPRNYSIPLPCVIFSRRKEKRFWANMPAPYLL